MRPHVIRRSEPRIVPSFELRHLLAGYERWEQPAPARRATRLLVLVLAVVLLAIALPRIFRTPPGVPALARGVGGPAVLAERLRSGPAGPRKELR